MLDASFHFLYHFKMVLFLFSQYNCDKKSESSIRSATSNIKLFRWMLVKVFTAHPDASNRTIITSRLENPSTRIKIHIDAHYRRLSSILKLYNSRLNPIVHEYNSSLFQRLKLNDQQAPNVSIAIQNPRFLTQYLL